MATNTTYDPINVYGFNKNGLLFNAQGITQQATASQTTNVDFQIVGDQLITGAYVLTQSGSFGDTITFQVVDKDGIFAPAGTVLNQFVTNWYVRSDSEMQVDFELNYPAKIINGLYLRLVYVSVGSTNPSVAINYFLHQVLE